MATGDDLKFEDLLIPSDETIEKVMKSPAAKPKTEQIGGGKKANLDNLIRKMRKTDTVAASAPVDDDAPPKWR